MIGKFTDHQTDYPGIFVHEEDCGGPIEYWLLDDQDGCHYIGTVYPTKEQLEEYQAHLDNS